MQQLWEEVKNDPFIGHVMWGTLPPSEEAQTLRIKIEQKIIQNNNDYKRYPSDFVHGLLSLHAYQEAHVNEKITFQRPEYQHYQHYLTQWTVNAVHDLPRFGKYYAVSYKNEQTRQLVLAHRGITTTWSDLFDKDALARPDLIGVLGSEIVAQQKAAYLATKATVTYAKENNYHFSTTGHSLGAWLAELSIYYSVFEFDKSAKAVIFDSPGSIKIENFRPHIVKHDNACDIRNIEVVTYLSAPSFVNTCHRQVGQVYRVYPKYVPISHFTGSGREGFWSLCGHSLAPLLATFDPATGKPVKYERMAKWPVMTYTPRDKEGKNRLAVMLIRVSPDASGKKTITSLMELIADVWAGRIDQAQYLACWQHLSACPPDATPAEKVLGDQFSLRYKGSYAPLIKDSLTGHLVSGYKGGADCYLKKLYDCAPEKIAQYFGEDSLITQQLKALKAQYHIAVDQGHYWLVAAHPEAVRERILRLVDVQVTGGTVKTLLETHEQQSLIPATFNLTSDLSPSLGSHYIWRTQELSQIDDLLADHAYVIISGEPGVGKTSLVTEYGHRQINPPHNAQIVIKIDADSQGKIDSAYRSIATELGIRTKQQNPEMVMRLVHSQISSHQKKILLIFDNVENYQDVAPYIAHLPAGSKAIITTRHYQLVEGESIIKVKPFTYREAARYISSSAVMKERIRNPREVQALLAYYAKGTNYIVPYHLNRAISLIKQKPIGSIKNYLKFVKAHPDDEGELILQQKLMAKTRLAWPMLQYAAYLDADFIDFSVFEQLFSADKDELNAAIRMLESLSIIYVVRKREQEGLALPRLTQEIIRGFINSPSHQRHCLAKAAMMTQLVHSLDTLCPQLSTNPDQDWQQVKKLMPHVDAVLAQVQDTRADDPLTAELWDKSGDYANQVLGLGQKAQYAYQKALAIRQRFYPDQLHPDVAASLSNLGISYAKLGGEDNRRKGMRLRERALSMLQTIYPDQSHSDVAGFLNNIGISCEDLGEKANKLKGLALQKQALAVLQMLYPDQPHPDVAASLNAIGITYENLGGKGNKLKGLRLQEQALAMLQTLYPDQPHPDIAGCLYGIGISYENLEGKDNRQKGLRLQEQALAMRQALYPDQARSEIADCLYGIGISYENLKGKDNKLKGLRLQEQALAMRQALYPDQLHPDIADCLYGIGISYGNLKGKDNKLKGLRLQEQALAMRRALYPDQLHPDVADSLDSVGVSYAELGGKHNTLKGLRLQEQALAIRQVLYPDQPHSEIADSLDSAGRY
jgi:trehalose utilization protein